MTPELIRKYAQPVPRYTSYPTAPHFLPSVGSADYRGWLADIPEGAGISLYLHVPFCDRLCWYCGCNTKATARYEPVARYLEALTTEMDLVARAVHPRTRVDAIHLGGGSPSILEPDDILRLTQALHRRFAIAPDAEYAIELDPRHVTPAKVASFAAAGINRVSIGVQDFDPAVQAAINRRQSIEDTAAAITSCRDAGIGSINIDLVYGLPRQTRKTIAATVAEVIALKPDRIALFGYAHLPSRLVHQRRIVDTDLPGTIERFAQANRAANRLLAAGYRRIGLDHFALPTDKLAAGDVRRNFQGYTTDAASTLIGLGASAIGRFHQGYVQNTVATAEYERRIHAGDFAIARGRRLDDEDRARGAVIETLLCDLVFSVPAVREQFPAVADDLAEIGREIIEQDADGLVAARGTDGSFDVTERGRVFLRSLCACFDAYLGQSSAVHAAGV